jgi:hypothetical protein
MHKQLLGNNYQGISLLSITCKVYVLLLMHHLGQCVGGQLHEVQCSFYGDRGTINVMFVLHQLSGQAQASTNLQMHLTFIDFTKAYDIVNWDAMWHVLHTYGVPTHLINLLENLHSRTQAIVRLGGHLGHNFPVTNGVRQGYVATPFHFNVFLDFIVKEALRVLPDCGVEIEFWFGRELVYTLGSGFLVSCHHCYAIVCRQHGFVQHRCWEASGYVEGG